MTGLASAPATMLDKIWARHLIQSRPDGQDLIFVDRHFIHDVTAPAFELLRARKLKPRARDSGISSGTQPPAKPDG